MLDHLLLGLLRGRVGELQEGLGGADGDHGAAASLLAPRPGDARHRAVTSPQCPNDMP
jgi:hypothetical protein